MERATIEGYGRLFGRLVLAPPCLIWAVNQLGMGVPWTWRTWMAAAIINGMFDQSGYLHSINEKLRK